MLEDQGEEVRFNFIDLKFGLSKIAFWLSQCNATSPSSVTFCIRVMVSILESDFYIAIFYYSGGVEQRLW